MNRVIPGTLGVCLIISLSFLPVIYGETEREAPAELTIEVHMPDGIETTKKTVTSEDMDKLSALLDKVFEELNSLDKENGIEQMKEEAFAIITSLMSELEKIGIITKSEPDIFGVSLFSIVYGSGTQLVRATPDFFITYVLLKYLGKLFDIFPSLEELYWEYLFFLMIRPRVMIPACLVLVHHSMEVHTLGMTGKSIISKSKSNRQILPDILTMIGFTGLWISVKGYGKTADSWLFGTALYVA